MGLLQVASSLFGRLVMGITPRAMKNSITSPITVRPETSNETHASCDRPVYIEYISKSYLRDSVNYGMRIKTNRLGDYTVYRCISKDFPIPDPYSKSGCELFLGCSGLMSLDPPKDRDEKTNKKTQKEFDLLSLGERDYVKNKIEEGYTELKKRNRDFHYIILQSEKQADWCMTQVKNAKRVTDLCVEIFVEKEPENKNRHPDCSKDTYKIEDKTSINKHYEVSNISNSSRGCYGYANSYQNQNPRHDGTKWGFDKREWVDDVPKPIHPTPVLLEGEILVEIPEE